jgi:hypothetical protein
MSPQVCVLVLIFAISAYAAAAGAQSWVQQVQGSSSECCSGFDYNQHLSRMRMRYKNDLGRGSRTLCSS